MRISSKDKLIVGKRYWYISVPRCCHFNLLGVKNAVYVGKDGKGMNDSSLYGMILFDNPEEANAFRGKLELTIEGNNNL